MSLRAHRRVPSRPYHVRRINAGSSIGIQYQSVDRELNAVTLGTDGLRWRLDNLDDSKVVKDWTTVTGSPPDQRGTITIAASDNVMEREYRDEQLMQLTIEFTDASGNKRQVVEHYIVYAIFQGSS